MLTDQEYSEQLKRLRELLLIIPRLDEHLGEINKVRKILREIEDLSEPLIDDVTDEDIKSHLLEENQ